MSPATLRRIAGLLVIGLVATSLPARVWLFGACPICGQIHVPILVAHVGAPVPGQDDESDSPHPNDPYFLHGCCPPLPYCPTASGEPPVVALPVVGHLRPQSDPQTAPVPAPVLIRPPRA